MSSNIYVTHKCFPCKDSKVRKPLITSRAYKFIQLFGLNLSTQNVNNCRLDNTKWKEFPDNNSGKLMFLKIQKLLCFSNVELFSSEHQKYVAFTLNSLLCYYAAHADRRGTWKHDWLWLKRSMHGWNWQLAIIHARETWVGTEEVMSIKCKHNMWPRLWKGTTRGFLESLENEFI